MANAYEQGRRDGSRGLERSTAYADVPAHHIWTRHVAHHDMHAEDGCSLDCRGLETISELQRKHLRQQADGLAQAHHRCPVCQALFRTQNLAESRANYEAGYLAGLAVYGSGQARRRADHQRKKRRSRL